MDGVQYGCMDLAPLLNRHVWPHAIRVPAPGVRRGNRP
jgi:hypothetical protein